MALLRDILVKKPRMSNFNMSKKVRTTMAPGCLYPIYNRHCLPGDKIEISLNSLVKTYPTLAPLMGSFKLQVDHFFVPWRLYVPPMRVNTRNELFPSPTADRDGRPATGPWNDGKVAPSDFPLPYWSPQVLNTNLPSYGNVVNLPGGLADFLGIPPDMTVPTNLLSGDVADSNPLYLSALPYLAYWDIVRNYYVNDQENSAYYCAHNRLSGEPELRPMLLSRLDDFFRKCTSWYTGNSSSVPTYTGDITYFWSQVLGQDGTPEFLRPLYGFSSDNTDARGNNNGLFLRTYPPDRMTSWLDKSGYDVSQWGSRVQVTNGSVPGSSGSPTTPYFTNDQMIYASKLGKLLNRNLLAGGRYADWLRSQFGVTTMKDLDIPQYLGDSDTEVLFEDILSTAQTDGADLATRAGTGIGVMHTGKRYCNVTEHGTYMIIASLVPNVDYYQDLHREWRKTMFSDCYVPALGQIGMQDLQVYEMEAVHAASSNVDTGDQWRLEYDGGLFKQPAWIEYMTDWNRCHADFTSTLRYWTLSRTFAVPESEEYPLRNFSSYVSPWLYNYAFADTSPDAHNFQVQFKIDAKFKRCIGKRVMPTL